MSIGKSGWILWHEDGIYMLQTEVFERERINGHYGPSVFVISHSVSSVSFLLLISSFSGAIAYFLTGLQSEIEQYVYFVLMIFAGMMLVESLQMVVAQLVPNFLMGLLNSFSSSLMILSGGFFRLPNDLPQPFWKYPMYYIAFHKYAYQGLYKNEFIGLTFPDLNSRHRHHRLNGGDILRYVWQVEMGYSKWIDLGIVLGTVVVYRIMFILIVNISENMKSISAGRLRFLCLGRKKNFIGGNSDASPIF